MQSGSTLALMATLLRLLLFISVAVILLSPSVAEANCGGKKPLKAVVKVQMSYAWKPMVLLGPEDKPAGFTPLLCVAHGPDYSLWASGKPASPGIKPLLQYADYKPIIAEMLAKVTFNGVGSWVKSGVTEVASPGSDSVSIMLEVSGQRNATIVSCIAGIWPSPDWFVGFNGVEMCGVVRGKYAKTIPVRNYDADFDKSDVFLGAREDVPQPGQIHIRFGLGPDLGSARISV